MIILKDLSTFLLDADVVVSRLKQIEDMSREDPNLFIASQKIIIQEMSMTFYRVLNAGVTTHNMEQYQELLKTYTSIIDSLYEQATSDTI